MLNIERCWQQVSHTYLWLRYLMFMARKTKEKAMPIMAKTEITMKRVMLMRDGTMRSMTRSTGALAPASTGKWRRKKRKKNRLNWYTSVKEEAAGGGGQLLLLLIIIWQSMLPSARLPPPLPSFWPLSKSAAAALTAPIDMFPNKLELVGCRYVLGNISRCPRFSCLVKGRKKKEEKKWTNGNSNNNHTQISRNARGCAIITLLQSYSVATMLSAVDGDDDDVAWFCCCCFSYWTISESYTAATTTTTSFLPSSPITITTITTIISLPLFFGNHNNNYYK